MLPPGTQYQVRISELRFAPSLELGSCEAFIRGYVKPHATANAHYFSLKGQYDAVKRLWGIHLQSLRWTSPVPKSFFDLRNVESICKALAGGFRLLWMQPVPGTNSGGAQIRVGQTLMSEEQGRDAFSIVRGDILSLYRLDWSKLWPAIENRLMHDPEFWVNGFTRKEAVDAARFLKTVFP